MYKVEFKGLSGVLKKISGILGLSLWELLMSLPYGTPGGIYLAGFGILRQDFGVHHVISISNHREASPHSLHTQELPFYWPNTVIVDEVRYRSLVLIQCNLIPFVACYLKEKWSPLFKHHYFREILRRRITQCGNLTIDEIDIYQSLQYIYRLFGLISLFDNISTIVVYLMPKSSL